MALRAATSGDGNGDFLDADAVAFLDEGDVALTRLKSQFLLHPTWKIDAPVHVEFLDIGDILGHTPLSLAALKGFWGFRGWSSRLAPVLQYFASASWLYRVVWRLFPVQVPV